MFVPAWVLILVAAFCVVGPFWIARLRRQVKCMRFCFIQMSDWAGNKVNELKADCNYDVAGRNNVPDTVNNAPGEWERELDDLVKIMLAAGLARPHKRDTWYILTDDPL